MVDLTPTTVLGADKRAHPGGMGRVILHRFLHHLPALLSLIVLGCIVLLAIIGPFFVSYSFADTASAAFIPPGAEHVLGTDQLGHDVLAEVLRGTQFSLLISLTVAVVSTAIGVTLGAVSGYFGGIVDGAIMRLVDLFLIVPQLALAAIVVHAISGTWYTVALILALFGWMPIARITRGEALALSQREFIEAACALGAGNGRIIVVHLIPNMMGTITVNATLAVATAVLTEAGLSFINLGVQLPDTSLGLILQDNYPQILQRPWLFFVPFAVIVLISLTINFIGDGLRKAFDPGRIKVRV